jgi:hypothetical protein
LFVHPSLPAGRVGTRAPSPARIELVRFLRSIVMRIQGMEEARENKILK